MSSLKTNNIINDKQNLLSEGDNDPFALIDRAAELLWQRSELAINKEETSRVSDEAVTKIMTAAVKLYAAKTDGENRTFKPILGNYDEIVTPTEALTTVTEILRSLRLGPMEFGLWSRRKPEDYHDLEFNFNNLKNDKE